MTTLNDDRSLELTAELRARLDRLPPALRERTLRQLVVAADVCAGDERVAAAILDAVA